MRMIALLSIVLLIAGCNPDTSNVNNNEDHAVENCISFPNTDKISITYYAKMSDETNPKTKDITDAATVQLWLNTLAKIPQEGSGKRIKMGDVAKYIIDFYQGKNLIGTLRVLGSHLDAPAEESYDFYSPGIDDPFVDLVAKLFP
ncbi:hypothetical protein [Candidatus Uabimicrobium amorphum]|uniref:Uncharacterized protein n=1 Tax=Uabimicrobium amorphum TaxID=2596890 RepID=A0A5S9IIQ7_UABAM|nr:hypothetical protein [Candidatus Uabimicrobium amorphum]BBM82434.1 hypothetical protein UABAM_00777 [Candidatus Uabimicrobium amorphum]